MVGLGAAGVATFAQLYACQALLPEISRDLDVSPGGAALTVSVATLGLALAVVPWSFGADRLGHVRVMRFALVTSSALGLVVPLLPSVLPGLEPILVVRFLTGLALAAVPATAVAYLHHTLSPRAAAAATGIYIAGTTVGGAAGRLLAGPLAAVVGWRAALGVIAVVCVIAAVVFVRAVPAQDGHAPVRSEAAPLGLRGAAHRIGRVVTDRPLLALCLQPFLLMGAFVATYNYLTFRLETPPFDLAPALAALCFLAYGAGTLTSSVSGRWTARWGRRRVVLAGAAAMALGAVAMLPATLFAVVPGLLLLTAGYFAAHSTASSWVGRRAGDVRSQAAALYNVSTYAGSALLGWAVGPLFQAVGWAGVSGAVVALAVVCAVGVGLATRGVPDGEVAPQAVGSPRQDSPGQDSLGRGAPRRGVPAAARLRAESRASV
ncbi:MFS transporter [Miniimonas sp. S16]|uniref:MFS transporter n=1 Tax=Miniimonas sp. S16 TaxID=2171623 RepID=UPI000D527869|nr:MFS transporter [Miniimonas sp. S16]